MKKARKEKKCVNGLNEKSNINSSTPYDSWPPEELVEKLSSFIQDQSIEINKLLTDTYGMRIDYSGIEFSKIYFKAHCDQGDVISLNYEYNFKTKAWEVNVGQDPVHSDARRLK